MKCKSYMPSNMVLMKKEQYLNSVIYFCAFVSVPCSIATEDILDATERDWHF